ncbi:hypothetical protein BDZ89DRAFT_1096346 [Hymenopellis radicata]|nr:hypothetical protein BDZ89DRAFT_1096346 [Hymenopellis radicata]
MAYEAMCNDTQSKFGVEPIPRGRIQPAGRGANGISALHIKGYVNSMDSAPVKGKLDSGADITLMSEEFFNSRADLPPLKQGMRIRLYQLTSDAKILGYTTFAYLVETVDGKMVSFEVEAYVVRGMITPLLLSEDFQTSYELGVERRASGHCFVVLPRQVSSSLTVDLGFDIRQSFAHTSSFVRRKLTRRARAKRKIPILATPPPVYAAQDTVLKPGYVQYLEVVADWGGRTSWIVDKVLIADDKSEIVAIATSWIDASNPYLPMANPGTRPIIIRAGELIWISTRRKLAVRPIEPTPPEPRR